MIIRVKGWQGLHDQRPKGGKKKKRWVERRARARRPRYCRKAGRNANTYEDAV